ncbi:MAG TPA: 2-dehydro-3-deoxygalactonokinase [Kofleriaceae bacterium]|nr:2-dehydro-3-deoxygalactonokinase [Kofleriaceae bacterium]
MAAHLIALDWGTTSLRAYRFDDDGEIAESRELPLGILRIASDGGAAAGFARAFDQACGDWRSARPASAVIACGMIGSAQGWREAAYLELPASIDALGRALTEVATGGGGVLHIIPGLIARGPLPDVLRGEETQVAGAIDAGDPPARAGADTWFCLPGTHAKWVRVRDRQIVELHTFMTGELFAALCAHTILGRTMRPPPAPDDAAFDRGVAVARSPEARAGVLSTMFSARTLGLVGALSAEAQPDYLSGLLIGHEIAAVALLAEPLGAIVLAGSDELCRRYRRALAGHGHAATAIAPRATERGLWRIARAAGLVAGGAA